MDDIVVDIRSYTPEVRSHTHDLHHQIVLPARGHLELELAGGGGRVVGGLGAFIVAGRRHAFHSSERNSFVVLDVPASVAFGRFEDRTDPFFPIEADVQGLLDYLTAAAARGQLSRELTSAWLGLLFAGLDTGSHRSDRVDAAIARAVAFMHERLGEPIRTIDIARAAGLGLTRLHAAFRARLAASPHAYLASLRLDEAERLLATTCHSIAEIAMRCGHADQSALTRALKRDRGRTPAALRRSLGPLPPADKA